jgi:hypothetical protein
MIAHESDVNRLVQGAELAPDQAARLIHRARVYLGEISPDAPEPEVA